ncbi:MAG: hypothetical protein AAGB93_21120 [Planctomycetota bacterium]
MAGPTALDSTHATPAPPRGPAGSPAEGPGGGHGARPDALELVLLALALVVGLLRFVRLGRWSLWFDEVLTWGDAHGTLGGVTNDVGYVLVRWTVDALGGEPTEAALRLLPAVAGFLAIPATCWAFRPLAGGRRAALAALVVAVSAWQLQWSQTARFYTLVQLTALVGAGVTVRGALAGSWLRAALGIAVAGAGVLFHLSGAICAAAIGGALLFAPPDAAARVRRASRAAFFVFAVPGALAIPFVWGAWSSYRAEKRIEDPLSGLSHFALSTGSYVTPALGAFAVAAALLLIVRRDRPGLFALLVPVLGGAALAVAATLATVSAQYAFVLFPWIALVAAWPMGLDAQGRARAAPAALALALVLPQLAESMLYLTVQGGQRPRWREAVELVAQRRAPGDRVLSLPASVTEFYLTGGRETDVRRADSVVRLDGFQARPYETWAREGRRMWFVLRMDYLNSFRPEDRARLLRFLAEECRLVERFPVLVEGRDLSIEVWRSP